VRPLREREGMILLNVLLMVAIAAAAVTVMIAAQDIQIQRTGRMQDAAQAQAFVRAGELSAVVALRRDLITAPDRDHPGEPWAAVAQGQVSIPRGTFALSVEDEQARFNLNLLAAGDPIAFNVFASLCQAAGVSAEGAQTIATVVAGVGPLRDEGQLRTAGVDPLDLERLRPLAVLLPPDARLNLNSADPRLLEIVTRDPAVAREIVARRAGEGLGPGDLPGLAVPSFVGVTSDHYQVRTRVRVGNVTREVTSRLTRLKPEGAPPRVAVTGRARTL
jgi:general secretion pathway protein K